MKSTKRKNNTFPQLKRKAWKLMSECVRRGEAVDDMAQCVSCGDRRHWKELHAGHFIHAGKAHPLSYDFRNVHVQCPNCNYFGNLRGGRKMAAIQYTRWMQKRYGEHVVETLMLEKHQAKELRRPDLERVIETLKARLHLLASEICL